VPSAHIEDGIAFRICVADHRPPLVRAVKDGTEVVIQLEDPRQARKSWERRGMNHRPDNRRRS
jgi:hypothetical protein